MKKVPFRSSTDQTQKINDILGNEYSKKSYYTIDDIMNILPWKIEYNGDIGYLRISPIDIIWSSLETEMKGSVVLMFQCLLQNENLFDAFYAALEFIKNHNVNILEE